MVRVLVQCVRLNLRSQGNTTRLGELQSVLGDPLFLLLADAIPMASHVRFIAEERPDFLQSTPFGLRELMQGC